MTGVWQFYRLLGKLQVLHIDKCKVQENKFLLSIEQIEFFLSEISFEAAAQAQNRRAEVNLSLLKRENFANRS